MKGIVTLIILIFTGSLLLGCSTDNYVYPKPDDAEAALFDLTLENSTTDEVTIFLRGTDATQGFKPMGNVSENSDMIIEDLGVNQTYVVRAAFSNQEMEDYFYEQSILQDSPTDLRLVIEESP